MRSIFYTSILTVSVFLAVGDSLAQPVTTCGQRVTDGVLVADLDCTGFEGDAIQVESSLELGGFTLTGGIETDVSYLVRCVRGADADDGNCSVTGPGTIRGAGGHRGNSGVRGRSVLVESVSFEGNLSGVTAIKRAEVRNCTISGANGNGVSAHAARVYDTTITDSGAFGVRAGRSALLVRSTVTGSVQDGVTSGAGVMLRQSSVVDNAGDPAACAAGFGTTTCGQPTPSWICADISADKRVVVRDASACGTSLVQDGSCGSSWDYRPGESFGVCTSD